MMKNQPVTTINMFQFDRRAAGDGRGRAKRNANEQRKQHKSPSHQQEREELVIKIV
jgi:hypothetical protein